MTPSPLAQRLPAGDRLLGTLVQDPAPAVAVGLARRDFDWLFLDGEHGGYGPAEAEATLAALGGTVPCLLRVPSLDEAVLVAAAACGVDGLILPHLDTAAQAEAAVEAIAGKALVVVQAESREALAGIGAIARVPGLAAVFVGPYDLTASLGIPGQFGHPAFLDAVGAIAAACREVAMPLGIFRMTVAELQGHEAQGFTLLAAGIEGGLGA